MTVACMPIVITMLDIMNAHVMMDFLVMVLEFWVVLIWMNVNRIHVLQLNIVSIQWEAIGFSTRKYVSPHSHMYSGENTCFNESVIVSYAYALLVMSK